MILFDCVFFNGVRPSGHLDDPLEISLHKIIKLCKWPEGLCSLYLWREIDKQVRGKTDRPTQRKNDANSLDFLLSMVYDNSEKSMITRKSSG
jgi:hypothetical protein